MADGLFSRRNGNANLCLMEPDPETRELTVTALYPGVTAEAVQAQCGWKLKSRLTRTTFPGRRRPSSECCATFRSAPRVPTKATDPMREVFICEPVRTPIGRYGGALSKVRADDLAAIPIRALMARIPASIGACGRGVSRLR